MKSNYKDKPFNEKEIAPIDIPVDLDDFEGQEIDKIVMGCIILKNGAYIDYDETKTFFNDTKGHYGLQSKLVGEIKDTEKISLQES